MRRGAVTPVMALATTVLAAGGLAECGSSSESDTPATTRTRTTTAVTAAVPCRSAMTHGVIPAWARAGFSDPQPRMAYAVARAGRIAGLAFGDPLHVPPGHERANKILWVARRTPELGSGDLRISAQRMEGPTPVGEPVSRTVDGGPGPSTVHLPHAGCWRLSLSWSGTTDQLDVEYVAG